MNIDELTLGQIKQLQAVVGGTATAAKGPIGGRHVVVVDRGWIFAGDLSRTADGYVRISDAVHVFRWESIGFAKALEEWKSNKVDLRPVADVEVPEDAIVFRVPVPAGWGKK